MIDLHKIEVKAGSDIGQRLCLIDGIDVTKKLAGLRVAVDGSSLPQVYLEVTTPDVDLELEGTVHLVQNLDPQMVLHEFLREIDPQWLEEKILENYDPTETTGAAVIRVLRERVDV